MNKSTVLSFAEVPFTAPGRWYHVYVSESSRFWMQVRVGKVNTKPYSIHFGNRSPSKGRQGGGEGDGGDYLPTSEKYNHKYNDKNTTRILTATIEYENLK